MIRKSLIKIIAILLNYIFLIPLAPLVVLVMIQVITEKVSDFLEKVNGKIVKYRLVKWYLDTADDFITKIEKY